MVEITRSNLLGEIVVRSSLLRSASKLWMPLQVAIELLAESFFRK